MGRQAGESRLHKEGITRESPTLIYVSLKYRNLVHLQAQRTSCLLRLLSILEAKIFAQFREQISSTVCEGFAVKKWDTKYLIPISKKCPTMPIYSVGEVVMYSC